MTLWTLLHNNTERLFEDWGVAGLTSLSRVARNQMPMEVSFIEDGTLFDADLSFAFGDEITIKKNGLVWFIGVLKNPVRLAQADGESVQWTAKGVGDYLDRLIFRQPWKYLVLPNDLDSGLYTLYLSHLILFQKPDGTNASIKEQSTEIFTRLIEKFGDDPKLQFDSRLAPTHQAPFIEIHNLTCGSALRECMRTAPDVAIWEDYSTTPPTIRLARRTDLAVEPLVIYPVGEGPNTNENTKIKIIPRHDLQVPAVAIEYEISESTNGRAAKKTVLDVYPADADMSGFDVIPQTISLEGQNISFPVETISSAAISIFSDAWWKARRPELAASNVSGLRIRGQSRTGILPYFLLPNSGPWAPWMPGLAEEITVICYVSYELKDTKNGVVFTREIINDEPIRINLMSTNLTSGTYTGPSVGSLGEPIPVGMAQALWLAASELQYDGEIQMEAEECSGRFTVGKVINIVGSRSEWLTARAMIQEVHEDIDTGTTRIVVGPPKFLGPDDLMEWLRGTRRNNMSGWATRTTGIGVGGSNQIASRAPKESIDGSIASRERIVMYRPSTNPTQTAQTITAQIVLDVLHALGKVIQLRETKVCDDGVERYGIFLRSEFYDNPLPPLTP